MTIYQIDQLLKLSVTQLRTVAGGKGANLIEMLRHNLPVPSFFVVSARVAEDAYLKRWGVALSEDPQASCERVQSAASAWQETLKISGQYAVRSSAGSEDGKCSFAGQLNSYLQVDACDLKEKIFSVFGSVFDRKIIAYRKLNRLALEIPAVVVQQMVSARSAGVIFSHDPVQLNEHVVVALTSGLGDKLVAGTVDGTTLYWQRQQNNFSDSELISSKQSRQLLDLLKRCESIFGGPQDIEFALTKDQIYLLQARPITVSADLTRIFDGSNIQESYPGITSPLTFSFINGAYREVYKSFCRIMAVSEDTIQSENDLFSTMLGYIDGYVYYNMASWYRLLSLLPAYKTNRSFMEGMMGAASCELLAPTRSKVTLLDHCQTLKSVFCLIKNYLGLNQQIKQFNQRLEATITTVDLDSMSLDQLYSHYRNLEAKILCNWQAPVMNDFFAMISFGLLKKLAIRAKIDSYILLKHGAEIVSAEPPRLIAQIAAEIQYDSALCQAMEARNQTLSLTLLRKHSVAQRLYSEYIDRFGDRCIGELKLETKSVKDDPLVLLSTIGILALNINSKKPAQDQVTALHRPTPIVLQILAAQTRQLISQRENLRFARTKVFGRVRKIVQVMGQRLAQNSSLDNQEDVYYLTIDELLGYIDGTAVTTNLKGLVSLRKEQAVGGAGRIVFQGAVGQKRKWSSPEALACEGLKGQGLSAGIVRGYARVINNPEDEVVKPGEILIAVRTDPGWIVHFATCSAIVVAHGSVLSHTAIVARELGMPAVVCKRIIEAIETGDLIEVNGTTGNITILEKACEANHAISA